MDVDDGIRDPKFRVPPGDYRRYALISIQQQSLFWGHDKLRTLNITNIPLTFDILAIDQLDMLGMTNNTAELIAGIATRNVSASKPQRRLRDKVWCSGSLWRCLVAHTVPTS